MGKTVYLYGEDGTYGNYAAALRRGGAAVRLTRDLYQSLDCDALLLPGGGDILGDLDATDTFLIQSFAGSGRPILGICRGMQALNVYFGGTLFARIPGHQSPEGDLIHPTQTAGVMRELWGPSACVTSNHHQAVERLGTDLEVVQWARDGVIEAIVHKKLPIWGVQWHPERQSYDRARDDAVDAAALFHYFLSQEAKK